MTDTAICPKCGSHDAKILRTKRVRLVCDSCDHVETLPDSYDKTAAGIDSACRKLAETGGWLVEVERDWPSPIAHEYHRIRSLLLEQKPNIANVVWQLKDFAEVLLKLPTLLMFREICAKAPSTASRPLMQSMLTTPLSMGNWSQLSLEVASVAIELSDTLKTSPLARLYRRKSSGKKSHSNLSKLLEQLVEWRNQEIGHGAFRLDQTEYLESCKYWITKLNSALKEHREIWRPYTMVLDLDAPDAPTRALAGWKAISGQDERDHDGHSKSISGGVFLGFEDGSRLALQPYVSLRQCAQCQKVDIFFFDSYKSRNGESSFLDYYRAHKNNVPDHLEESIALDYMANVGENAISGSDLDDMAAIARRGNASMRLLLEERQTKAKTVTPAYLREPLKQFIDQNDCGIYWLEASGHIGKTTFVADLVDRPILPVVRTCAYHIKREYNCTPAQFAESLLEALKSPQVLDLAAGEDKLPDLPSAGINLAQAFISWLGDMRRPPAFSGKILICIDGLDELPVPGDAASIADYLPDASELPDGVFLLVTSRPPEECPPWLAARLPHRKNGPMSLVHRVEPEHDSGYRSLLRAYFYSSLKVRWEKEAVAAFDQARSTMKSGKTPSARLKAAAHPFFRDESLSSFNDFAKKQFGSGSAAQWDAVFALVEDYERLFAELLETAEYKFLFFGYLVDTIESTGDWRASNGIPQGKDLLKHVVIRACSAFGADANQDALQVLGGEDAGGANKNLDLAIRLMHTLAAAEEAFIQDSTWRTKPERWHGLRLGHLAQLLSEDDSQAGGATISNRLVYVLYTLKALLQSDKREEAKEARFSLGLGMTQTIRTLCGSALDKTHGRIARQFINTWKSRFAQSDLTDGNAEYGVGMVMAHALKAASDEVSKLLLDHVKPIVNNLWGPRATAARDAGRNLTALCWFDRVVAAQQWYLEQCVDKPEEAPLVLAAHIQDRREISYLIARLGGQNNARLAIAKMQQTLEDGAARASALAVEVGVPVSLIVSQLATQQQLGYLLREFGHGGDDLELAKSHQKLCRAGVLDFIHEQVQQYGKPVLQASHAVLAVLILVRATVELVMCERLGGASESSAALLDEAEKVLNNVSRHESHLGEISDLQARIMHLRRPDADAILTEIEKMKALPKENRTSNYEWNLAAMLNTAGELSCGRDEFEKGAGYFIEAGMALRPVAMRSRNALVGLAGILNNQISAQTRTAMELEAEMKLGELSQARHQSCDAQLNAIVEECNQAFHEADAIWEDLKATVESKDWQEQWVATYARFRHTAANYFSYVERAVTADPVDE